MELLNELIKIYTKSSKRKYKEWLKEIINNLTKIYITNKEWNLRERWLAKKYYTIWKIYIKNRKNNYKPFTLEKYRTWGRVVDVYDGDTIKVLMNFRGVVDQWTIRMNGYDSPEIKPLKNKINREKEIDAAKRARDALIVKTLGIIYIKIVGLDKYGRLLADIYKDKLHINKWMIENGYGYVYNGGKKQEFK